MAQQTERRDESVELLQLLIRNSCVNDGSVSSGGEKRSADLLADYLGTSGFDLQRFTPVDGRSSLLVRMEGTDPTAPTLMLMGHTDVVPVSAEGWSRDPFGGELVDGFVWGRGAIDMLNETATMAVAMKRLAARGFRPRGTLMYLAVADEEALGTWGAEYLVEHEWDHVQADYVITESGGNQLPTPNGIRLPIMVTEKGTYWTTLRVHGTPAHGSQPHGTDNALVTAAEVVRRIAAYQPPAQVHSTWEAFVSGFTFPPEIADALVNPERIDQALDLLPDGLARMAHACTHSTFSPNVIHGGTKTNTIPDAVDIEVDIRTMPGEDGEVARAMLLEAIGDLAHRVDIHSHDDGPTDSPVATPLWDSLQRVTSNLIAGSALLPMMMVGGTDNRFFRRKGSVGYGFGLFSQRIPYEEYSAMFHGHNERVDVESLDLAAQLWEAVVEDFLG
ncbi:MAG: M20/M25/M40 family metallo-hydrolase [Acidimicrobiia bacterium]